jgi:hypothetical protein
VDAMCILDRWFAVAGEEGEDGAVAREVLLASNSGIDCIFAEAADSVMLEVSRRRFVLRVLEATNTTNTQLAPRRGTGEKMAQSSFMVLNSNVGLEERIDR